MKKKDDLKKLKNTEKTKKSEVVGISGHVRVFITDNKTGVKRLVFDDHNAIQAAYANAIVDALDTAVGLNYSMDNLFNGNTNLGAGNDGEDGIAIKDNGGLWYEMIMATPVVSGGETLFVGTFTGTGITVANAADVQLGHNWVNAGLTFGIAGVTLFALPSSWASQAVAAGETLTIEWTIGHQST